MRRLKNTTGALFVGLLCVAEGRFLLDEFAERPDVAVGGFLAPG